MKDRRSGVPKDRSVREYRLRHGKTDRLNKQNPKRGGRRL